MENKTTDKQRNMLHAIFGDVANATANEGISLQEIIAESFELIPTKEAIKEITKIVMKQHWGITSTNDLSSQQIDTLIHMWQKKVGKWGIEIDIPEQ